MAAHRARPARSAGAEREELKINAARIEKVLVGFLGEESARAGRSVLLVGLSGGLDSATAVTLAVRAVGPENVIGVLLPYRTSNPASARDARALGRKLGIRLEEVDISPMVDAYFAGGREASRGRRGNKMARERMSVLYDLSEQHAGLVVGTSNKTEMLLGYGTLHGDLACALNPLGDLYKTQVRQLAAHLGVPRAILAKAPTADLWPGQTDEDELGITYAVADRVLHLLVDRRAKEAELLAAGFDRALVRKVREMIRRSQFKRRLPLLAKVSQRTVGVDFRYPRDWGT
jgi:NAD+ synthase